MKHLVTTCWCSYCTVLHNMFRFYFQLLLLFWQDSIGGISKERHHELYISNMNCFGCLTYCNIYLLFKAKKNFKTINKFIDDPYIIRRTSSKFWLNWYKQGIVKYKLTHFVFDDQQCLPIINTSCRIKHQISCWSFPPILCK